MRTCDFQVFLVFTSFLPWGRKKTAHFRSVGVASPRYGWRSQLSVFVAAQGRFIEDDSVAKIEAEIAQKSDRNCRKTHCKTRWMHNYFCGLRRFFENVFINDRFLMIVLQKKCIFQVFIYVKDVSVTDILHGIFALLIWKDGKIPLGRKCLAHFLEKRKGLGVPSKNHLTKCRPKASLNKYIQPFLGKFIWKWKCVLYYILKTCVGVAFQSDFPPVS